MEGRHAEKPVSPSKRSDPEGRVDRRHLPHDLPDDGSTGRVTSVSTIARDITERRQAEAAVRASGTGRSDTWTRRSHPARPGLEGGSRWQSLRCSLLGWTADELLGRDWIETCLPARIRDELRTKFRNLVGGDLSVVENPVLTRSGEERLIEWRNTLLRDDEGHVIGTFSSGTDITERTSGR